MVFLALLLWQRLVFLNFCLSLEILLSEVFILDNHLLTLVISFVQFWVEGGDFSKELLVIVGLLLRNPLVEIAQSLFYDLVNVSARLLLYFNFDFFRLNRFALQFFLLNFVDRYLLWWNYGYFWFDLSCWNYQFFRFKILLCGKALLSCSGTLTYDHLLLLYHFFTLVLLQLQRSRFFRVTWNRPVDPPSNFAFT